MKSKIGSFGKIATELVAVMSAVVVSAPVLAAPGDLDRSFSMVGRVLTDFNGGPDFATAVAVQTDGKIVAAGSSAQTIGSSADAFAVARYYPNGSLDVGFGTGGKVRTPITTSAAGQAMALQRDGKIVVAGVADGTTADVLNQIALARYNADGSLDGSFGSGGTVLTHFGPGSQTGATAVAIQTDGRILVAGSLTTSANPAGDMVVLRYQRDGSLDPSFDGDGRALIDFEGRSDRAGALTLQSDGRIVVAGWSTRIVGGSPEDFAVARLDRNGALDRAFDGDGRVRTHLSGSEYALAVVVQADDRIVIAGRGFTNGSDDFALVRYNSNGSLDASFGTAGVVLTNFGGTEQALDVTIQSDGKIVAVGQSNVNGADEFAVARYNRDGTLDTTFDGDGRVLTSFGAQSAAAAAVALQSDGRIVAAGFSSAGGTNDFALARYQGR